MTRARLCAALLALIALLMPRPAPAVCLTCACTVTPAVLLFTSYTFNAATQANGSIGYSCTGPANTAVPLQITLSSGHGTFAQRTMTGPASLNYNIFLLGGQIFGDGTNGTSAYTASPTLSALGTLTASVTAVGIIPSGQAVVAGLYSDALVETVSF